MADIHTLPTAAEPVAPAPAARKPRPKRPSKIFRAPAELVEVAEEGCRRLAGLFEVVQRCILDSDTADQPVLACVSILEQANVINDALFQLFADFGSIKDAHSFRQDMLGLVVANARRGRP